MGKEAVVAVIERRGEVIYYKASTIHFKDNNNNNYNHNNPIAKTIDEKLD
jgi:hypothetical protein